MFQKHLSYRPSGGHTLSELHALFFINWSKYEWEFKIVWFTIFFGILQGTHAIHSTWNIVSWAWKIQKMYICTCMYVCRKSYLHYLHFCHLTALIIISSIRKLNRHKCILNIDAIFVIFVKKKKKKKKQINFILINLYGFEPHGSMLWVLKYFCQRNV
jgi:hypothetical protein